MDVPKSDVFYRMNDWHHHSHSSATVGRKIQFWESFNFAFHSALLCTCLLINYG